MCLVFGLFISSLEKQQEKADEPEAVVKKYQDENQMSQKGNITNTT